MVSGYACRRSSSRPTRSGACAKRRKRGEPPGSRARRPSRRTAALRDLLEAEHRAFEVDADAVLAQELVADDAAKLEAQQRAGRVQVQDDDREVLVGDLVEQQVDTRHQER